MSVAKPKLLDQVRSVMRTAHYSHRTEDTYCEWIKRFILFHDKRHPKEMGEEEAGAFLSHLAVERNLSASSQNQALSALLFLYAKVLERPLAGLGNVARAKTPRRAPVVLTRREVAAVLGHLRGVPKLAAQLMYGSGLRLLEALRLRVKDVDSGYRVITVRDGKGFKDRVTMLPGGTAETLGRTFGGGEKVAPAGFAGGVWRGVAAVCHRAQIPERGKGVSVAICVPGGKALR
jgi:integrase